MQGHLVGFSLSSQAFSQTMAGEEQGPLPLWRTVEVMRSIRGEGTNRECHQADSRRVIRTAPWTQRRASPKDPTKPTEG